MSKSSRPAARPWPNLPEPANYFEGKATLLSVLPRAPLVFSRHAEHVMEPTSALHFRYVLMCCISGGGGVILDGRLSRFRPGDCVLVFPYQSHYYTPAVDARRQWFFTSFEYAAGGELSALRDRVRRIADGGADAPAAWLDAFLSKDYTGCAGLLAGFLGRLLATDPKKARTARAARERGTGRAQPAGAPAAMADDMDVIARASALVDRRLPLPCDGAWLAVELGLSPGRLRGVFRRGVGIALGEYIRRARIYRACNLLRAGRGNVGEVAEACGFSSLYAFSRAFTRVIGQSPKRFKNDAPGT